MTRNTIRVVHLLYGLDFGGVERHRLTLAKYWPRESEISLKYWILTDCGRTYKLLNSMRVPVEVRCLNFRSVRRPVDFGIVRKLLRLLDEEKVDLLHTVGIEANLMGGIAARMRGIPVIAEEVGMPIHTRSQKAKLLMRFVWKWIPRRIIAVYGGVKQYLVDFEGVNDGKILLLHNPLDISLCCETEKIGEKHKKKEHLKGVFIGRLVEEKNVFRMLEAINTIQKRYPTVRFFIVGEGPLKKDMIRMVKQMGCQNTIQFLGFVDDVRKILKESDFIFFPSYYETFPSALPLAVLEAMCCGVIPVISGRADEFSRYHVPRKMENLVFSPYHVDEMIRALTIFLEMDPETKSQLALTLSRWVRFIHDPERYIHKLRTIYDEIIRQNTS